MKAYKLLISLYIYAGEIYSGWLRQPSEREPRRFDTNITIFGITATLKLTSYSYVDHRESHNIYVT